MADLHEPAMSPAEFWSQVRSGFIRRYPDFEVEDGIPVPGRKRRTPMPSVVGPWAGRKWEVSFLEPRTFYPDMLVGVTTAVRLIEPANMPYEYIPWLYAGERPRVLSKNVADFERIIMRYRRRKGNFKGTLTGDPELDRKWGIYPSDDRLASVFHERDVHQFLRSSQEISPNPKSALPTVAVYGTEATFTLPTHALRRIVPKVLSAFDGFGHILDRLEEQHGMGPASRRPISMDIVRDERGMPFPVSRFDCPLCQQVTHPRYQATLETEVCERCGKTLYRFA